MRHPSAFGVLIYHPIVMLKDSSVGLARISSHCPKTWISIGGGWDLCVSCHWLSVIDGGIDGCTIKYPFSYANERTTYCYCSVLIKQYDQIILEMYKIAVHLCTSILMHYTCLSMRYGQKGHICIWSYKINKWNKPMVHGYARCYCFTFVWIC